MATLNPGVLVKLLEEMNSDEKPTGGNGDHGRSPMLQIRSIVPVMEEGDLWPNRGFYLKVSDSSHAVYVSLPPEYDEMIFNNKLQLGQYIYVQELEPATPVPILRGIKLVPGRYHQSCVGSPEDLVVTKDLIGYCGGLSSSDSDSLSDRNVGVVVKKPVERPRSLSASRASQNVNVQGRKGLRTPRSIPMLPNKYKPSEISISCSDRDSDSDSSSFSFFGKPKAMRRSWNSTKDGHNEWPASPVVVHETRPLGRSRSAGFYPCSYGGYDTDDSTTSKSSIRRNTFQASKTVKNSGNRRSSASRDKHGIPKPSIPSVSVSNRKWAESDISWGSLPPNLEKLGKEVLQQRDAALAAAAEALQEACAAERLIQCLSGYSEVQSTEDSDPQSKVVRLLDLHDNTAQARMITQSLQMSSSLRTDTNSISPGSIKESLKLRSERKKCAVSWMRAALATDLSQFPDPVRTITDDSATNGSAAKQLAPSNRFNKLKSGCCVRKQRKNGEIPFGLTTVEENSHDWVKGTGLHACIELDNALKGECRKCFLTCVEKFLDGIINKTVSTESDSQLAGVMCQIKRVDEWLDMIASKDNNSPKDGSEEDSEDEDGETCKRLRNKLYVVLLKHVERSAIALESMRATL